MDEFAVFLMLYHIYAGFGNNVDTVVHYDNPFWISADTKRDDLE